MEQKDFRLLYEFLFGLEITTMVADLKWEGQYSRFIQVLAIYINFSK